MQPRQISGPNVVGLRRKNTGSALGTSRISRSRWACLSAFQPRPRASWQMEDASEQALWLINHKPGKNTKEFLQKKSPQNRCGHEGLKKKFGSDLLSHQVSLAVPSALRSLTSVFGMRTGVSFSLWPPKKCFNVQAFQCLHVFYINMTIEQVFYFVVSTVSF